MSIMKQCRHCHNNMRDARELFLDLEPLVDTYCLGYGGYVEQAFPTEGLMQMLSLCGEVACGLILSLSQGLA